MKKLYVDMDGTIAVWKNGTPLEIVSSKGYFRSLPAMYNVVCAIKKIIEHEADIEVCILSSVFRDEHSVKEKKAWLSEVIPEIKEENMFFVPYGERKSAYVEQENAYLLDDFSKNLHEWKGIGIKIYNGINGNHGSWHGYSVHSNMTPETLYRQLSGIIKNT